MTDGAAPPVATAARGGFVRRVGRVVLWPLLRFFDPRFQGLATAQTATLEQVAAGRAEAAERFWSLVERFDAAEGRLEDLLRLAEADMDAATEATAVIGTTLAELVHDFELLSRPYVAHAGDGTLDDLDERSAAFLNYAASHRGFAAQAGLWLNPPVALEYGPGSVAVVGTNERIVEVPYTLRALAAVRPGGRLLDVGSAESTLAFSLACLGYDVTALDPRGYPFEHPRLRVVAAGVEELERDYGFDAIVCLSTIEHIGVGAYDQPSAERADLAAMRRLGELAGPGCLLVLTTPFGRAETAETERRYDRAGLDALLEGWDVDELVFARRSDATTWTVEPDAREDGADRVALVTARRAA